jgi:hypothetical protein
MKRLVFSTHIGGSRRQIWIDFAFLTSMLLLSVYFVYFASQSLARLFFLALLIVFFFSKKDYLWFAFFLIIMWTPGYLFSDFSGLSTKRLPLYSFIPGWSFTPLEFFLMIAFVKAIIYGKKVDFVFKKAFIPIVLYAVLLLLLSFFVYGTSGRSIEITLLGFANFTIFLSFSYLIYRQRDVQRFIYLLSSIVFFVLFEQLFYIIAGYRIIDLLSPGYMQLMMLETGDPRFIMGGEMVLFFGYISSLLLLQQKHSRLLGIYLYCVIIACFLSVFLSATRIWFIVFSFIMLWYVFFSMKNVRTFLKLAIVAILIFVFAMSSQPLRSAMVGAWDRIDQIEAVAQGDFADAPTFQFRFSARLPRLLVGLSQNWILGWGFSDEYFRYSDGHVGNFDLLLQVGAIGFLLFSYLWIFYFRAIFRARSVKGGRGKGKDPLAVLAFAFAAMLIAHFSTYLWFTLVPNRRSGVFLLVFISISEFYIRSTKHGVDITSEMVDNRGGRT